MRHVLILLLVLFWFVPCAAALETVQVTPDMGVELEYSPARWTLAQQAPEFLVEETAEHLEHELEGQGKQVTAERIREVASKRLAANESYLFNPDSRAVLTIDFSPLREGEKAPREKTLKSSARLAAGSLEQEEGVTEYESSVKRFDLAGTAHAYRIDASYRRHGEPTRFIGVVAFAQPYWIFLYYTDPLRDSNDLAAMNRLLESTVVVPRGE